MLQLGTEPYRPTSSASGVVGASTTGFAKLSDVAINGIADGDPTYDYFKFTSDVIRPPSFWKLADTAKNCIETCGGQCDLEMMKTFAAKRISDTSVVNKAWADVAGFSTGQCTKAQNGGGTMLPGIYPAGDCRPYTDLAGAEAKIECDSAPTDSYRRMCACKPADIPN